MKFNEVLMNDYIPIIVGTKLAFSENIFEYKRINKSQEFFRKRVVL